MAGLGQYDLLILIDLLVPFYKNLCNYVHWQKLKTALLAFTHFTSLHFVQENEMEINFFISILLLAAAFCVY